VLFWPVWTVLRGLGVTQGAEFEEQLDPMRKYLICCVPHGAYAFSSLWMRHNSDFNCTWKTSNIK